jgi:hypothetical protein
MPEDRNVNDGENRKILEGKETELRDSSIWDITVYLSYLTVKSVKKAYQSFMP